MTIRKSNALLLAMIPILLVMIYYIETIFPQVTIVEIPSARLADFFGERTVVQITDLHVVTMGQKERLDLNELERLHPDLILMTGDYVDDTTDFAELDHYLARLSAIGPIVAIPGNNDYYCLKRLGAMFGKYGIIFLKNESLAVSNGADTIYIVGLEDNFRWHDNYFRAIQGVPEGAPRIVLGHAPTIAEMVPAEGVELILSGHLHGGQIVIPFYGPMERNLINYATTMYRAGLYNVDGKTLYSNRGLGTSIIPARFMSRPEIAVFKFTE